jgi:putative endonuclease
MSAPSPVWRVYIVRCADDSLYTGVAKDVVTRVGEHNKGCGAKYTRSRLPVELVYTEDAADRGAAQRREAAIKKLSADEKCELVTARARAPRRAAVTTNPAPTSRSGREAAPRRR